MTCWCMGGQYLSLEMLRNLLWFVFLIILMKGERFELFLRTIFARFLIELGLPYFSLSYKFIFLTLVMSLICCSRRFFIWVFKWNLILWIFFYYLSRRFFLLLSDFISSGKNFCLEATLLGVMTLDGLWHSTRSLEEKQIGNFVFIFMGFFL